LEDPVARKRKIDEKIEARIKELEDELLSLKADYVGAVAIGDKGELGPGFAGVITYHGELVPVLDGAALGAEGREMDVGDHIIYFTAGDRRVAVVVSAVVDVETFDSENIISAGDAGLPRRFFLGVYEQNGGLTRIIEPSALLPDVTARAAGDDVEVEPNAAPEPDGD
jgi:hypothetical protein